MPPNDEIQTVYTGFKIDWVYWKFRCPNCQCVNERRTRAEPLDYTEEECENCGFQVWLYAGMGFEE